MTVAEAHSTGRQPARATTLGFSARTDYGVRALLELGTAHDVSPSRRLTAEQIAEAQHLPAKYLESILGTLVEAGVLESLRGAGGGYRLTRPPEEISIWLVVRSLEGEVLTVRGLSVGDLEYDGSARHLTDLWAGVASAMAVAMEPWTLRDLLP